MLTAELNKLGVDQRALSRISRVRCTAAQIKTLRATPKVLVPAPGSNKMIELISAVLYLDYGTSVLTESTDNLAIRYGTTSGPIASEAIEMTGFIDQSADSIIYAIPLLNAVGASADIFGKSLVLHNTGNGEFGGNAANDTVLRIFTMYRLHKFA